MIFTSDITLCQNDFCEMASDCKRFMSLASENQSYAEFRSVCRAPTFQYFIPLDDDKTRIAKQEDTY